MSTIRRIIRRDSAEHKPYLDARFNDVDPSTESFLFDGHRWAYSYSSFDDDSEYDVITRPGEKSGDPIRDVQRKALRDQFAMAAMQGDWASRGSDELITDYQKAAQIYYRMADAMLAARNEREAS